MKKSNAGSSQEAIVESHIPFKLEVAGGPMLNPNSLTCD